eukprot:g18213.t1
MMFVEAVACFARGVALGVWETRSLSTAPGLSYQNAQTGEEEVVESGDVTEADQDMGAPIERNNNVAASQGGHESGIQYEENKVDEQGGEQTIEEEDVLPGYESDDEDGERQAGSYFINKNMAHDVNPIWMRQTRPFTEIFNEHINNFPHYMAELKGKRIDFGRKWWKGLHLDVFDMDRISSIVVGQKLSAVKNLDEKKKMRGQISAFVECLANIQILSGDSVVCAIDGCVRDFCEQREDGSTVREQRAGAAAVAWFRDHTKPVAVSKVAVLGSCGVSPDSLDCEAVAASLAPETILAGLSLEELEQLKSVIIVTDSNSLLSALLNYTDDSNNEFVYLSLWLGFTRAGLMGMGDILYDKNTKQPYYVCSLCGKRTSCLDHFIFQCRGNPAGEAGGTTNKREGFDLKDMREHLGIPHMEVLRCREVAEVLKREPRRVLAFIRAVADADPLQTILPEFTRQALKVLPSPSAMLVKQEIKTEKLPSTITAAMLEGPLSILEKA